MSRGHVGLVAFYFPPSRASGVYRMLALANHLVEQDFEVTVFTVTPDFFEHITQSSDESLLQSIDPRVEVERVPLPMQHLETHPRRFHRMRGNFPELHKRLTQRAIKTVWLDQYGSWVPGLLTRMMAVHRRHPLDVVLATGNPYSCYQAPWLFKKATGVPYVLDSRDSWTLNLFTDEPTFAPGHPAYTWEKRTFDDAELICFVNTPLLEWHQRTYPQDADKMIVVANGYDTSVVETLTEAVAKASAEDAHARAQAHTARISGSAEAVQPVPAGAEEEPGATAEADDSGAPRTDAEASHLDGDTPAEATPEAAETLPGEDEPQLDDALDALDTGSEGDALEAAAAEGSLPASDETDEDRTDAPATGSTALDPEGEGHGHDETPEEPGVRFGYVGTLTGNQPHDKVWAGWRVAKEQPEMASATMNLYGHIGFFGVSRQVARVLPTGDPTQDCTWHGPVAKAEIGAAYAAIDVLVMIVADSRYVTSGKVFEYMATGKPVVGLYEDDCAVADVLDDYPLVVKAASLEEHDVARAFVEAERLAHTVTDEQRAAARTYAERFERVRQMTPLVERLGEIAARPREREGVVGRLTARGGRATTR